MSDQRPFHLKQFSLLHNQSTMKVGTDAMLLGSWIDIKGVKQILDIGTGCGILSLILAQRSEAMIDAVEIDELSAIEASRNFKTSRWSNRLNCFHDNITHFAKIIEKEYDLIISNPPFFTSAFKTNSVRRNLARHTDTLDFETLIRIVSQLLALNGRFAIVLPFTESQLFIKQAEKRGLFVVSRMEIIPGIGKECNRVNLVFSRIKSENIEIEIFTIRNFDGTFTDQYNIQLKDFYLGL